MDIEKCLQFEFVREEDRTKILELLGSYSREIFPRSIADACYLHYINNLGGGTTLYQLAEAVNRTLPTVVVHLNKLIQKGFVKRKRGQLRYGSVHGRSIYSITKDGVDHLKSSYEKDGFKYFIQRR
jgi:DNA-binding MarR family transcriptional regulator